MKLKFTFFGFLLLMGISSIKAQCIISDVFNDWNCDGNGKMVDLFLNVDGQNMGNLGFTVAINANTYTAPNYSVIQNVNISTPSYTTTTCSVEFPTCCLTKTFDNACRLDCEITSAIFDFNCGENGGYINSMVITPEGYDLGNDGFTVTINGNTYSNNSGTSIQINSLFIPSQTFTYTICSNESPTCCYTETIALPCFVPCDISSVDIDQTCSNDTLTALTFSPSGINLGIDGFSIEIDGATYSTSGVSLEITNLAITDPTIDYTICCNEYPTFCNTFTIENECFGNVPVCNITSVNTAFTCTSTGHYKLTMEALGSNLGSQGFRGMVNGVAFNKNTPVIVLDSLLTSPLAIFTICSNASPTCCFKDTLVNPCFVQCSIANATAVVSCDTNSLTTLSITPSGTNLGSQGFSGSINSITFNQDSTTIVIDSLISDSLLIYIICSNASPSCCYIDTIANPCFSPITQCGITSVTTDFGCSTDSLYSFFMTPIGSNFGNLGFHGRVNNVSFDQVGSTIVVDSLTADSIAIFTICSNASPNCCFSDTLINPCFVPAPQCNIASVDASLVCMNGSIENIVFTIHATNYGNLGFSLLFNDSLYTSLDSIIEVDGLNITDSTFTYTACSVAQPSCCLTQTRLNPCDLNCNITAVNSVFNCDTLFLVPMGNSFGSLGFSGAVNGVPFNQPSNIIVIDNVSTLDSLIVFTICSNAFPTCCYTDTIVNLCFVSNKACSFKVSKMDLSAVAGGYSLSMKVTLSGTCPTKLWVWQDDILLGNFILEDSQLFIPIVTFASSKSVFKICAKEDASDECIYFTINNPTTAVNETIEGSYVTIKVLGKKKFIAANSSDFPATFTVYNLQGIKIKTMFLPAKTYNYEVDLESLIAGMYILQMSNKQQRKSMKVILLD